MTSIIVIGRIKTTGGGPTAQGPDGEDQPVHLAQGDLDGACGPYCLFMALLILGVVRRDEIKPGADGGDDIEKLFKRLHRYGGFFRDGTDVVELKRHLKEFAPHLMVKATKSKGVELRDWLEGHITEDHPVILGLRWGGEAHWVLVVGLEYETETETETDELRRILVLDPGDPAPTVSAWNGVVDARGSGGIYPYRWWTAADVKVQMEHGIAIWDEAE